MAGLSSFDCEGVLTIGGISMNRAAWAVVGDETGLGGLLPLWIQTEQRGQDRLLPGAVGVIAYRRRETVTRHDLRILVVGDVDQAGATVANAAQGLAANLAYLETNVVQPTNLTDGTRAATLTVPGLATRSANIHVLGLVPQTYRLNSAGSIFIGTLQISIPSGRFV
jgi:hypothetical protein